MSPAWSAKPRRRRFLIGMLACGENEKMDAIAALKKQDYGSWDFFLIEGVENKAAHEKLYGEFDANRNQYDFFLKLDADMVFRRDTALREIAGHFEANPDVAGISIDLIDFYTNSLMPGLRISTSAVSWPRHDDRLMVDAYPQIRGRTMRIADAKAAVAWHSPNPSPLQAFRFGVHRALKAIQNDRLPEFRSLKKARLQWRLLNRVWSRFADTRDVRRGLAVAGAEFVLSGRGNDCNYDYMAPIVVQVFSEAFERQSVDNLYTCLAGSWEARDRNDRRWHSLLTNRHLHGSLG